MWRYFSLLVGASFFWSVTDDAHADDAAALADLIDQHIQARLDSAGDYKQQNRAPGVERPIPLVDATKNIQVISELL